MAADITMRAGSTLNIQYTLQTAAGVAYPRSSLERLFFYIREKRETSAFVKKSDENNSGTDTPTQIAWVSEEGGTCTVKLLPADTVTLSIKDAYFELRAQISATSFITFDYGTIDILPSIVGSGSDFPDP